MRVSENQDLVPDGTPPPHSRLNGHNSGFAVEMTRRGNRGKVLPRLFHRSPPRLGIPQTTRDSNISTATAAFGRLSTPKHQTRSNFGPAHFLVENANNFNNVER